MLRRARQVEERPLRQQRQDSVALALFGCVALVALVVTHNMDLAARMDRRVTIRDGRVSELG
jgi:lipoprotein-releasing system ATP-binding protein